MRASKATFEVCVKCTSKEYESLSELMIKFGGEKSGVVTVNGVELDVYAMDASIDVDYPYCVTFKITTKALHPEVITDLLTSIYTEKL